jgi:hypothetical protein
MLVCSGFGDSAGDENSLIPLTLSFQHVEFNQGGLRNARTRATLRLCSLCGFTAMDGTRRARWTPERGGNAGSLPQEEREHHH